MIAVTSAPPAGRTSPARLNTSVKFRLPNACHIRNMAIRKPKSPIRFTMKAFLPASALAFSENQKPIRR